jgi:hypothetical protein
MLLGLRYAPRCYISIPLKAEKCSDELATVIKVEERERLHPIHDYRPLHAQHPTKCRLSDLCLFTLWREQPSSPICPSDLSKTRNLLAVSLPTDKAQASRAAITGSDGK